MMDSVSEQRLSQVHPVLAEKVRHMADWLAQQGIVIRVVQGLRTIAEQNALYAQGRTTPGPIVTNAPGGHSYHCVGLAVDVVPSVNGVDARYIPDWNESHPAWQQMIACGTRLGLNSGALWRTFKDYPHFQLTGVFPVGAPPQSAIDAMNAGGVEAVWALAQIPNDTTTGTIEATASAAEAPAAAAPVDTDSVSG